MDLEVELISALEEIEKCRRRNKYLKEQLSKYKEEKKSKEEEVKTLQEELHNSRQQAMVSMKEDESLKQEVGNFKGEVKRLKNQQTINEKFRESTKTKDSKRLEVEIILLKKKDDEESINSKFENSSNILDDILSGQRPSSDKARLGYHKKTYVVATCNYGSNWKEG